jgi:superfamily II DNA or RNA helicase
MEQRQNTIASLDRKEINAIVAIKCLDEGVDIPSASRAIFLSNNTDAREYVQRLGRVLRHNRNGHKDHADIYDFIVMPPSDTSHNDAIGRNLVKNELVRSQFFLKLATNSEQSRESITNEVDNYGYYFEPDELSYKQGDDD